MDNINIKVQNFNDNDMEFDILGIDSPIANALRRIIISEVLFYSTSYICIGSDYGYS